FYSQGIWKGVLGTVKMVPSFLLYLIKKKSRAEIKVLFVTTFFKGIPLDKLQKTAENYTVEKVLPRLRKETLKSLKWHQDQGHRVILISANLDFIVEPMKEHLNIPELLATSVEVNQEGLLTGRLKSKNCWGEEKVNRLKALIGENCKNPVYAYGDSRGDKELLAFSNFPTKI
ncbi:HAD-IB family hydrolase, partial [Chlamydiales bacterium]|nr:HAD-IB family hydrolase [Chlamydiales bacterium]